MGDKTSIEWTDATWNPIRGCSRVSEGCRNCYAERVAIRQSGDGRPYEGLVKSTPRGPRWTGEVRLVPEVLTKPLRWARPRRIFVNSMGDLFHDEVSFETIAAIFGIMAGAPRHTFQILTKRPARMKAFFEWLPRATDDWLKAGGSRREWVPFSPEVAFLADTAGSLTDYNGPVGPLPEQFPLPNVWLGVSVEDQATADERLPVLLQCSAAVRWVSAEPLLGDVDIRDALLAQEGADEDGFLIAAGRVCHVDDWGAVVHWVVAGGESGPGARPMHPDWARSLRDECAEGGVAFLFKQWGSWGPAGMNVDHDGRPITRQLPITVDGRMAYCDNGAMLRMAKKAETGRLLDGRTWDQYPDQAAE